MSGTSGKVTRTALVGKQVYNPDGALLGTIQDVVLEVGEEEISLKLVTKYRTSETVAWSNIGAAADIVILKKPLELKTPTLDEVSSVPPPTPAAESPSIGGLVSRIKGKPGSTQKCPTCGGNLRWIKQYSRWYCDNDKKYA